MKKTITFSLALLFSVGLVFAQKLTLSPNHNKSSYLAPKVGNVINQNFFRLGYCTDEIPESGLGLKNGGQINAFIELNEATLSRFVGDKFSGIRVGFSADIPSVTASIRESLTGPDITSVTFNAQKGWNEMTFNGDVTIEAGKKYYVGYSVQLPAALYGISFSEPSVSSGAMWLNINGGEFADLTEDFGAISVQALLSGDESHFSNLANINNVAIEKYIVEGTQKEAEIEVSNFGINAINSIEFEYKYADNAPVKKTISKSIPVNTKENLTFPPITFDKSGEISFQITKVNDVEVNGNVVTKKVITYLPENTVPRKTLLEQFTTESCQYCPNAATTIKSVINQSEFNDKVIWVAHHAGFGTDLYTIDASKAYLRFYGGNTFAPAITMDRTIIDLFGDMPVVGVGNAAYVTTIFNEALKIPAFVTVNIEQNHDLTSPTKKVNVVASGEWKGDLPTDDMYVNVFLLEDNIPTTMQVGATTSPYIHNNVIRAALGGNGGSKITWQDKTYSLNFSVTLNEIWKTENLKIVAFVSKNYTNSLDDVQVLNAEQVKFDVTSNVELINSDAVKLTVKNRKIEMLGDYSDMEIFDVKGMKVNNSDLVDGFYIVKVNVGGKLASKKVIVSGN